jgi:hypothetical protein
MRAPAPAYIQALPREPEEAVEFLLLVLRGLRAACDSAGHAPGWGRDPLAGNPFAAASAGAGAHAAAQAALRAAQAAAAERRTGGGAGGGGGGGGGAYHAHAVGGAHGVLRSGALVVPAKCRLRAAALSALSELLALDAPGSAHVAHRRMGDDGDDANGHGHAADAAAAPRRHAAPTGAVPLATARAWRAALTHSGSPSGPLAPFVRHGGVAELRAVVADAAESPEVRAAAATLLGSVAPAAADEAATTLAYLTSEFVAGRRWRRHGDEVAAAAGAVAGLSPCDGLDAGRRAAQLPGYARRAELALPMLMALDAGAIRGPYDDDEAGEDADAEGDGGDDDDAGTAWGRRRSRAARLSVFAPRPAFPTPGALGGAHGALAAQTAAAHSRRRSGGNGALMPLSEELSQALRRVPGALAATALRVLASPTAPLLGAMALVRPLAVRVAGARGGAFNGALATLAGAGAQPFPIGGGGADSHPHAQLYTHEAAAAEDARLAAAALAGRLGAVRIAGALAAARALLTAILSPPPPGRSGAGGALTLPPAAGRALAALIAGSRPEVAAAILAHAAPLLLPLAGASASALSGDADAAAGAARNGGRGDSGGGGGGDEDADAAAARRGAADAALRAAAAAAPVLQYVHVLLRAALAGAAPLAVRSCCCVNAFAFAKHETDKHLSRFVFVQTEPD